MDEILKRLREKLREATEARAAAVTARKTLLDAVEAEQRSELTEEEETSFRTHTEAIKAQDDEIRKITERLDELEAEEERTKAAEAAATRAKVPAGGAQVTDEPLTYAKRNGNSYIRDLVQGMVMQDPEARDRLSRHAEEVRKAPEFKEVRALDRTDGSGGYFVPPAWLMNQWIELARPGRPAANLVASQPLPPGTDSINIPKVTSGTAVAVQATDGGAVNETPMQDDSIAIPVRTIAGEQTMAQQLLDQSPLNFDEIVFRDLLADYAVKTDVQVLSGSGSAGQVTGFLNTAGRLSIATVGTGPTGAPVQGIDVYRAIANAAQQMHAARFRSPSVVLMHPRRWAWLLVQTDNNGRPLVVPSAQAPQNTFGSGTLLAPEGPVGTILGLPVVLDPSLPTNGGGGTEDECLLLRPEDDLLYESSIRTRVLPEIKSHNLQVVVQCFGYLAFSAARYPVSTAEVTGLVAPTF